MSEINNIEEIPEGDFPINLKLIQKYQRLEPSILAKYKNDMYQEGSFRGGSNIDLILITCKYKIVILPILQSCVLNWYYMYHLYPGIDRTEAMIYQHLY